MASRTASQKAPVQQAAAVQSPPNGMSSLRLFSRAVCLLTLGAFCSPLSQLKLAPVYGSIPSAQFHHLGTATLVLLALTRPSWIVRYIPDGAFRYLQLLPCWTGIIQTLLFTLSTRCGPTLGPVLTESLTFYPLVFLTALAASGLLLSAQIERYVHGSLKGTVLGLSAYGLFTLLESRAWHMVAWLVSSSEYFTRTTLQALVGFVYFVISPSKLYIASLVPLLYTVLLDPHSPAPYATANLQSSLQAQNWSLLERGDSVTGYVSVLENLNMQYRLMRCDHSILGGEWLITDQRKRDGIVVPEPIYAVFEMLEAVRLIKMPEDTKADAEKNALVIGLGIGTAPKALIAHGINTTIVELDPLVHAYALKYFDLPVNHTPVLEDAVSWVERTAAASPAVKYDYIIHDVFTGGAEPLSLFTIDFLQNLRSLLAAHGAIALNYAGDLSSPSTNLVLHTINTAFESQCRMFRDQEPLMRDQSGSTEEESDFLNMVIFCTNKSPSPPSASIPLSADDTLTFRNPTEADYLRSQSRRHYLLPRESLELPFPGAAQMNETAREGFRLLTPANMKNLDKRQIESAKRHWEIMRMVMPAVVWEGW
ncbi:hypothetical protein AAFC00_001697 [Neodothiora populina]|uniref:Spermine/spermidine synthase n=1 Tax=Neodothiora populina TaxID=2781224 RepID=A0ABR3PPU7_9PEZI